MEDLVTIKTVQNQKARDQMVGRAFLGSREKMAATLNGLASMVRLNRAVRLPKIHANILFEQGS